MVKERRSFFQIASSPLLVEEDGRVDLTDSPRLPSFAEEKMLAALGYRYIAGIDEVGRGALAGPVLAAAVILPGNIDLPWLSQVKDSKMLTPTRRLLLFHHIHETAVAVGVGLASPEFIDTQGIVRATRLAMKLAIEQLSPSPETLLIDYLILPEVKLPQKGIIDGDSTCLSIACASIIAKVTRDHLMMALDKVYPGYSLANHKGYGTREHLACLQQMGPSPIHRRSFRPVKNECGAFV
ncbi:MAG: ribonuclease HII [Dehalococcoidales bacterium]|nr:ribonuclease HII [Dehalococcoidales bacterium]